MICRLLANFDLPPLRILGSPINKNYEMEWMAHRSRKELDEIEYYPSVEDAAIDLSILIGTTMIYSRDRGPFLPIKELPRIVSETPGKIGIFFGREDIGLSKDVIEHCHYMLDFKLSPRQPSMNLSNSVAFVMSTIHNFSVQYSLEENQSNAIEKNHFYNYAKKIFEILKMNHFHGSEKLPVKRLKNILDQRHLSKGDLNFLYTIFKNIERLNNDDDSKN